MGYIKQHINKYKTISRPCPRTKHLRHTAPNPSQLKFFRSRNIPKNTYPFDNRLHVIVSKHVHPKNTENCGRVAIDVEIFVSLIFDVFSPPKLEKKNEAHTLLHPC